MTRFWSQCAEHGLEAFRSHLARALAAASGIAAGTAAIVSILAIMHGLDRGFRDQLAVLGPNTVYVAQWPWFRAVDNSGALGRRRALGIREYRAVRDLAPAGTLVAPLAIATATAVSAAERISSVRIVGTTASHLSIGGANLSAGRYLAPTEDGSRIAVVVLGADAADRLFPEIAPAAVIGRQIRIAGRREQVVGVLERRGDVGTGGADLQIDMTLAQFEDLFGRAPLIIETSSEDRARSGEELRSILRRVRELRPGEADDFSLNRVDELLELYDSLMYSLRAAALAIASITLLVAGIGITNVMLISVRERVSEIGLKRAVGATRASVIGQFLAEAALLGGAGSVCGTLVGLAIAGLVALVSPVPAQLSWAASTGAVAFGIAIAVIFGSWPAWSASRLDPADALRSA